jgi:hypothetical protein
LTDIGGHDSIHVSLGDAGTEFVLASLPTAGAAAVDEAREEEIDLAEGVA